MTALLAPLQEQADDLATHLASAQAHKVTLHGATGSGKSAILGEAARTLGTQRPVVFLRVGSDKLAATATIDSIIAQLDDQGYGGHVRDSNQDDWTLRHQRATTAMRAASEHGLVVAIGDADRLGVLAGHGGTPGRHARDVLELIEQNASRMLASRTLPRATDPEPCPVVSADLTDWLGDATSWPGLHEHAASITDLGLTWTRLPALSLRLVVALAALGHQPDKPPVDAAHAARLLANVLSGHRRHRGRWAAWQLLAHVRSPWSLATVGVLIDQLPVVVDDPILAHCLLHGDALGRWHMHPIVRRTGLDGHRIGRPLAPTVREFAGRAGIEHLRGEADTSRARGDRAAAALVDAQLVDCAALAADTDFLEPVDLPDPYDHVGARCADADADAARGAYRHARLVDGQDATALRGIAALAGDRAEDVDEAVTLLQHVLRLEPGDLPSRARLIGSLLAAGRPAAAEDELLRALAALPGPEASEHFATRLLIPATRHAIDHGDLHLAVVSARAAADLEPTAATRRLAQVAGALVESLEYGEFVAPDRLGNPWWSQPQLLADRRNYLRRDRWLACRIDRADDDTVDIEYADVLHHDRRPDDIAWLHLTRADLAAYCDDDVPFPLEGTILEIGLYGPAPAVEGDPEQTTVIRVVDTAPFDLAHLLSGPDFEAS